MRALAKLFLLLILLSPLAVAALAWLMLADEPTVTRSVRLSHADIARAKDVLKANDPRYLRTGETRTLSIAAQDLDLAANYVVQQLMAGKARVTLASDTLLLEVSRRLPFLPVRNQVNVEARVHADEGRARIGEVRIGQVPIPGPLASLMGKQLMRAFFQPASVDVAAGVLQDLRVFPDRVSLTYRWHPQLMNEARHSLLTGVDRETLRHYHDRLVRLQGAGIGTSGSLVDLLQALFRDAAERSGDYDPVDENTALLTVLGTWGSGQDLRRLVPGEGPRPDRFRLKLQGRKDFAQHFLISAALAARGDGSLSDAIGLFKEISDSDRGSGFSFTDIAADRSGTRFGELATRSPADARELQDILAAGSREEDIMPPARDLPEHLSTAAFEARFGAVGSPAYQAMIDEIDRRIDACRLYR
jgi:hypothetical protein